MHETPLRDQGDGCATGQPSGGTAGLDLRPPRLPAVQNGAAPGAGMVCGAKRIRSLYLPWMTGLTPKLSTTTPPKGLASLSTINAATMRLCRADLPATAHSSRLEAAPRDEQGFFCRRLRYSFTREAGRTGWAGNRVECNEAITGVAASAGSRRGISPEGDGSPWPIQRT
jgi:hypothetical protein